MEKSNGFYLIILIFLMVCCSSEQSKDIQPNWPLDDGQSHFVLYTNPASDCLDCNLKALKFLGNHIETGKEIRVYLKKSKHNANFRVLLEDHLQNRSLLFREIDLKVPHPSILLIKGRSIYMHLYISNDAFLLEEHISLCARFFSDIEKGASQKMTP